MNSVSGNRKSENYFLNVNIDKRNSNENTQIVLQQSNCRLASSDVFIPTAKKTYDAFSTFSKLINFVCRNAYSSRCILDSIQYCEREKCG